MVMHINFVDRVGEIVDKKVDNFFQGITDQVDTQLNLRSE